MARYCAKCGAEVTEGSKFCKSCGAPVGDTQQGTTNQKVQAKTVSTNRKSGKKAPMVIGIIAVIVVVLAGVGIKNVATSVPDYEKPLKYEIDGKGYVIYSPEKGSFSCIELHGNIKTYKKAFLDEKTSTGDENLKEYMKEIKKVSYEVESVENISVMGLLDTIAVMGIQSKDIQDAKTLKVSLEAKTEDGEHATTVEFDVIKINDQWYALGDLLY